MFILKLNNWSTVEGLKQIATTWQLASDSNFTQILESTKSDTMLFVYQSDVTVPVGAVVYARAMRHFNDNTADYWTDATMMINNEEEYSSMLLSKDVVVETPIVFANTDELLGIDPTFTITTSKYKGDGDSHYATHWVIKDAVENILFTSLYDTVNKTSITITKTPNITSKSILKIYAIHVSAGSVESQPGIYNLITALYNYEITSDLSLVNGMKDYTLTFKRINENIQMRMHKIVLLDSDKTTELITKYITEETLSVTFPWTLMRFNGVFYIDIYAYDTKNNYNFSRKMLTTKSKKMVDIIDPSYIYTKAFIPVTQTINYKVENNTTVYELPDSSVPLVLKADHNVYNVTIDNDGLFTNYYQTMNGISLLSDNTEYTYIKYLENDLVLVDTLDGNNIPTFMVYKHDVYHNTYSLLSSLSRSDELYSLGITNAITQISETEFIYIPYSSNKIKKYDISNNTITELITIKNNTTFKGSMIKLQNNQVLLYGGENFEAIVYNIAENIFTKSTSIMPSSFLNRDLKAIELINGDTILYRTTKLTTDTDSSVKYFNITTMLFEDIEETFSKTDIPTGVIRTGTGQVLFTTYSAQNNILSTYVVK
jgi:hypothetical protein